MKLRNMNLKIITNIDESPHEKNVYVASVIFGEFTSRLDANAARDTVVKLIEDYLRNLKN